MLQRKSKFALLAIVTPAMAVSIASTTTLASDPHQGKALYEKNCVGCHDDSVYKRSDRRVESFAALKKQITGCEHAANAKLSPAQIDDLTQYLNSTYYKFK